MTIELIETRDKLIVSDDGSELIQVITQGEQGVGIDPGVKGVITIPANLLDWTLNDNVVTSSKIVNGTIVNEDINDNAAIALTKLATGALPTAITVTSANISDLSIVNADINASAAIEGSKLQASSGSNSGTMSAADFTKLAGIETGATADQTASEIKTAYESNSDTNAFTDALLSKLNGIESNATADQTKSDIDALGIAASTATTLANARTIAGTSFDGSANIDISYTNLTNKLSVGDGGLTQNNFTDALKTKLDGIETAATADQTAAEIKTLLNSDGIVNAQIDASAAIAGSKISPTFTSDLTVEHNGDPTILIHDTSGNNQCKVKYETDSYGWSAGLHGGENRYKISNSDTFGTNDYFELDSNGNAYIAGTLLIENTQPAIQLIDSNNNDDFVIRNVNGLFGIRDMTDGADRLTIASDGTVDVTGNLDVGAGVDVTGNITVTGTVDGVDIAALNTTVGNLSLSGSVLADGTTATTQSASDNSTKVATTAYTDTAIANLVDSAPGTLNTLNELAAALGDDPNFATTVTNSIATKLPLAGGTLTGNLTIENIEPQIFLKDSNNNDDFTIRNTNGVFTIRDSTNAVDRLTIDSNGKGTFTTALDVTGDLTVESTLPQIILKDTNNDDDFTIKNTNGVFTVRDSTNGADRFTINSSGELSATGDTFIGNGSSTTLGTSATFRVANTGSSSAYSTFEAESASGSIRLGNDGTFHVTGNTNIGAGLDVIGNITVTGTVDGRDLATDGTKLDGIESNATADQTASEIVALVADQTIAPSIIDMEDNEEIRLGTSDDLIISHDGSNSKIADGGTGDLILFSNKLQVVNSAGSESMIIANQNAAVELYFDNSKKFETSNAGVDINNIIKLHASAVNQAESGRIRFAEVQSTMQGAFIHYDGNANELHIGTHESNTTNSADDLNALTFSRAGGHAQFHADVTFTGANYNLVWDKSDNALEFADNALITLGSSNDLQIIHDGSNSRLKNNTGTLFLQSNGIKLKNFGSTENYINCIDNGAVELYYDSSKKLETKSDGVDITGELQCDSLDVDGTADINNGVTQSYFGNTASFTRNSQSISINPNYVGQNAYSKITSSMTMFLTVGTNNTVGVYTDKADIFGDLRIPYDDKKLKIGAGNDLELYHDGNDSIITNSTGNLVLRNTSGDAGVIGLQPKSGENAIICRDDNAVELYYDNAAKIATTSTGVRVDSRIAGMNDANTYVNIGTSGNDQLQFFTGGNQRLFITGSPSDNGTVQLPADNLKLQIGASQDLEIYHSSSNYIDSKTGHLYLRAGGGNMFLNAVDDEISVQIIANAQVELYYDNSKKFETTSAGIDVTGNITATGTLTLSSAAPNLLFTESDANPDFGILLSGGQLKFQDTTNTANILTLDDDKIQAVKNLDALAGIDVTGNITVTGNIFGNDNFKFISGASSDLQIYHDGTFNYIVAPNNHEVHINANSGGSTENMAKFKPNAAVELYYDNVKQLQTTANGISFVNNCTFSDDKKIQMGAANDFVLTHTGSRSEIHNITGDLLIRADSLKINNAANTEEMARFTADGAVELYHNNSKKFETHANGVHMSGSIYVPDNQIAGFGDTSNPDLRIYHDGSNSFVRNSTGGLDLNSNTIHLRNGANTETYARFLADGAAELYYDNSKKLETTSDGVDVAGDFRTSTSRGISLDIQKGANGSRTSVTLTFSSAYNGKTVFVEMFVGSSSYHLHHVSHRYHNGGLNVLTNDGTGCTVTSSISGSSNSSTYTYTVTFDSATSHPYARFIVSLGGYLLSSLTSPSISFGT